MQQTDWKFSLRTFFVILHRKWTWQVTTSNPAILMPSCYSRKENLVVIFVITKPFLKAIWRSTWQFTPWSCLFLVINVTIRHRMNVYWNFIWQRTQGSRAFLVIIVISKRNGKTLWDLICWYITEYNEVYNEKETNFLYAICAIIRYE